MGVETRQTKSKGKVYDIRYHDASGKYVRETLGPELAGWTKAKALRTLQERRVAAQRGFVVPEAVSFLQVADDWLGEASVRKQWADRTVAAHNRSLQILVAFHQTPVAKLTARTIDEWAVSKLAVYSPKYISMALSVMRQVLDHAIRKGYLTTNPARTVKNPKITQRQWRILTPEEIQKIALNFGDDQHRLMFWTLVLTGLRRQELLQLRWSDIDFEECQLRVRHSKTQAGERSVALPRGLTQDLWEWWEEECPLGGYVFRAPSPRYKTSRQDGRLSLEDAYKTSFRAALKAAGITDYVRPFHDMRHTSLTNSAALEASPIALMTKAGHTDMKITRQYLHLAGIVFPDEANQLERRLTGAGNDLEE